MANFNLNMKKVEATRIEAAMGAYLNLLQPATSQEVKEYLIRILKTITTSYERRLGESSVVVPDPPEIT